MKFILLGLLSLSTVSAFAGKAEIVCSTAYGNPKDAIKELNVIQLQTRDIISASSVIFIDGDFGQKACVTVVYK